MKKKKKQNQKNSRKGVILLIILLGVVLVAYEPITELLNGETSLKEVVTEVVEKTEELTEAAPQTDGGLELPAPLKGRSEKILKRKNYTASYNKEWRQPNWVAWEVNKAELAENESRTNEFLPDPDLKESEAVTTQDYVGTGFDRGHMCPAADNRWHWKAMQESFYMSNICPQNHNLNTGDWNDLEKSCRYWVKEKGSLYIVCGPIFYDRTHETIGKYRNRQIPVPDAFFKVILCMTPPQAVGFIYPNKAGHNPMKSYARSVDEVEKITGIDFFPALEDEVEKRVEAAFEWGDW